MATCIKRTQANLPALFEITRRIVSLAKVRVEGGGGDGGERVDRRYSKDQTLLTAIALKLTSIFSLAFRNLMSNHSLKTERDLLGRYLSHPHSGFDDQKRSGIEK